MVEYELTTTRFHRAIRSSLNMLTLRSVTNLQDPALERLGRIQDAVYAEPDMLIPASMFGRLLEWSAPERQNFIIVAEKEGEVLGGAVFHLFPEVGVGFSSFLGVALNAQGQGVSSKLHHFRWQTLEDALKAAQNIQKNLEAQKLRGVHVNVIPRPDQFALLVRFDYQAEGRPHRAHQLYLSQDGKLKTLTGSSEVSQPDSCVLEMERFLKLKGY